MTWVRLNNISEEYATTLQRQFKETVTNEAVLKEINQTIADMIRPYVPEDNGIYAPHNDYEGPSLRESVRVGPHEISWNTPYAHYMYMGQLYGPNFPIYAKGNPKEIIGFYSPEGSGSKYPMASSARPDGRLQYTTEGTGPKWWDLMLAVSQNRRTMNIRITNILKKAFKNRRR